MEKSFKITAIVVGVSLLLTACGDALGDKYVSLAQCLTDKGVTMYGAYWCPHCANQKKAFGQKGFEKIKYVECDVRGENGNPKLCLEKKIESYPTWDFADGTRMKGEVMPENLAQKVGCPVPAAEEAAEVESNDEK